MGCCDAACGASDGVSVVVLRAGLHSAGERGFFVDAMHRGSTPHAAACWLRCHCVLCAAQCTQAPGTIACYVSACLCVFWIGFWVCLCVAAVLDAVFAAEGATVQMLLLGVLSKHLSSGTVNRVPKKVDGTAAAWPMAVCMFCFLSLAGGCFQLEQLACVLCSFMYGEERCLRALQQCTAGTHQTLQRGQTAAVVAGTLCWSCGGCDCNRN